MKLLLQYHQGEGLDIVTLGFSAESVEAAHKEFYEAWRQRPKSGYFKFKHYTFIKSHFGTNKKYLKPEILTLDEFWERSLFY
jgi:hypothetical protein